jgi:allantoinase
MNEYPRDLVGYADEPPAVRWPGGARLALNIVLNYEEGGERCVLHGDQSSETRLSDLALSAPRQNARDLLVESAYEYGARIGVWRLLGLLNDRHVPFTVYAVGMALSRNHAAAEAFVACGCDFVDHGWRWFDYHGVDPELERGHMRESAATIERLTGVRPAGYFAGMPSLDTRRLAAEEGYLYDCDAYNDEVPYWVDVGGRRHLVIPHTLDTNDTRLARGLGWAQADDFFVCLRDEFDALYRESAVRPRMMTVALHCRLAGKPARAAAFAKFLDYAMRHEQVWICRRIEIAEHWRTHHPPSGSERA